MTFISYAQNFEDVMLWRALKHVEKGFYIDIGAASPDTDSVTRAFYERGWHGINVEPNSEFYDQLLKRRTRDKNLAIAISDEAGTNILNIIKNTGLSTLDEAIAQKHNSAGWAIDKREIETTTLAALWKEYIPEGQEVHFLKIDVEGLEEEALRGNDWSKYRPWIVVIEATFPNSQQESHITWERILLSFSYHFAYSDGLNRFYVADKHIELLDAFKYPPNIFDDFKLNAQMQAEANAQYSNSELKAMQASLCWRMTQPLRDSFDMLLWMQAMFSNIALSNKRTIGDLPSLILIRLIHFVRIHPTLKTMALAFVCRYPALEDRLYRFSMERGMTASERIVMISEFSQLTPTARHIYTDLKAAIDQHKKEGC